MRTVRLTMAQALVRALGAQFTMIDGQKTRLFAGVWAIFGHGNVAGLGEALYGAQGDLPTFRAHNEQAMAHAAIAFAKASRRKRMMACTTSIGPGATNMITAAAVAHVNRLPLLLLPGDVFASRGPDPVLQQIENFGDGTVSANDCFRPVSRYFDRLTRPEQLIGAFNRAMQVLTDPAECGPVTLALCQDVQTEAFDYPESFFAETVWHHRRPRPDVDELKASVAALSGSRRPFIIAGGGVLYSDAEKELLSFAETRGIPVGETQAGKSAIPANSNINMGAIGVTGTAAANTLAAEADVVLAVGTRLQDFTTGSWSLFNTPYRALIGLNVQPFDAGKHRAHALVADAKAGLHDLTEALGKWSAPSDWTERAIEQKTAWLKTASRYTSSVASPLPSDAQVLGVVQAEAKARDVVVCAAGGLPGEMHKLWQAGTTGGYHLEYGYSCMGYEIAGGLGVKLADPSREVIVLVGDGSYLMMNSELATAVMLGQKITVVLLDNRGFGCINRLQLATGGASFNNLLQHARHKMLPEIDFAAHARALGANAVKVEDLASLAANLRSARQSDRVNVIVIDTDPLKSTDAGGHWWDVAVPEVSIRSEVKTARAAYEMAKQAQRLGD